MTIGATWFTKAPIYRLFRPYFLVLSLLAAMPLLGQSVSAADQILRVGVYENEPKLMLGTDGLPTGIFGDLLKTIAARENWSLKTVTCTWEECLRLLDNDELDLMPDVALSAGRDQRFDFHQTPALHSWSQLFAHNDKSYRSPLDLKGTKIAVLADSIQLNYLDQLSQAFNVEPLIIPVSTLQDALLQVQLGKADLAVSNHLYGNYHAHEYDLRPTAILFQPTRLFFATPRGQGGVLLERIDYWLERWLDDAQSPYYQILGQWGTGTPQILVPTEMIWIASIITVVLLVALAFIFTLRYRVRARTGQLQASEQHLRDVLSGVQAFIYDKDQNLRYQYANRPLCEFLGVQLEALVGKTDADFFDAATAEKIQVTDRKVITQGKRITMEEMIQVGGKKSPRIFMTVKMPLWGSSGEITGLRGVSTDITEQRQQKEQILQLFYYDPLTSLPNRRMAVERMSRALKQAARSGRNGALLLIDLDDFHTLNDTHGHEVGDQLLQVVTNRLVNLNIPHALLARFGGDEFIVLLENLSDDPEEALAEVEVELNRVDSSLHRPYDLNGVPFFGGMSMGVAMFSDVDANADDLVKGAELAMYAAKRAGKSRFSFFNESMQTEALSHSEIAEGIRLGLVNQEFELWYQPQYDADNQLAGLEALVRWQHPRQGTISPADFIPVAESSGLIIPLGDWILRAACRQLQHWAEHPRLGNARIAVNISARQLHHDEFVDKVFRALEHTGANPDNLELELTESLLVNNEQKTRAKIAELRARGVRFTLDDFGTGYSSLLYLKQLPIYKLKIDQGFVCDLLTDTHDANIVQTIIDLGHNMGLEVIAEGVENAEQKETLQAMGCKLFQGYYFGYPMPADKLEAVFDD